MLVLRVQRKSKKWGKRAGCRHSETGSFCLLSLLSLAHHVPRSPLVPYSAWVRTQCPLVAAAAREAAWQRLLAIFALLMPLHQLYRDEVGGSYCSCPQIQSASLEKVSAKLCGKKRGPCWKCHGSYTPCFSCLASVSRWNTLNKAWRLILQLLQQENKLVEMGLQGAHSSKPTARSEPFLVSEVKEQSKHHLKASSSSALFAGQAVQRGDASAAWCELPPAWEVVWHQCASCCPC